MNRSLLLASFVSKDELYDAIDRISETTNIPKDMIFAFVNEDNSNEYVLTYNLNPEMANIKFDSIWKNTISVHRKKQTNTIYSLNAMNEYIKGMNNGVLDKTYQVNWELFTGCMLIIKNGGLKSIPLRLVKLNQ